jgi:exodeoxyribonuclease X
MTAVLLDTEATGLENPELIEAAWLKIPNPNDLTPTERFLQRYNPGKPIALGALATHHIMDEDLVGCPPSSDFRLPAGVEYMVGYNIDYDWKVIGQPETKRICVLALCRYLFPGLDSYSQSAMLYHLNRAKARELLKEAHSAEADVMNCMRILWRVMQVLEPHEKESWEALWRTSELARIPTVMTFGKHKGAVIKDIPGDYKQWLLKQPDIDQYLEKALRGVVA